MSGDVRTPQLSRVVGQTNGQQARSHVLGDHASIVTGESPLHAAPAPGATLELVPGPWEISGAVVEGFDNKAKLIPRKAYGFPSNRCLKIALDHTLGQLPEPEATYRFC